MCCRKQGNTHKYFPKGTFPTHTQYRQSKNCKRRTPPKSTNIEHRLLAWLRCWGNTRFGSWDKCCLQCTWRSGESTEDMRYHSNKNLLHSSDKLKMKCTKHIDWHRECRTDLWGRNQRDNVRRYLSYCMKDTPPNLTDSSRSSKWSWGSKSFDMRNTVYCYKRRSLVWLLNKVNMCCLPKGSTRLNRKDTLQLLYMRHNCWCISNKLPSNSDRILERMSHSLLLRWHRRGRAECISNSFLHSKRNPLHK
jgi:hypothetical protein